MIRVSIGLRGVVWLLLAALALPFGACEPAGRGGAARTAERTPASVGRIAVGSQGAVVSIEGLATQIGLDVLRDGGNAVDASIAVGFALAVTHPSAGNIGGGGFMTLYLADEDRFTTLDFRERAPAAARPDMYLGEDGRPVANLNRRGWLSVGVPGTVAGFEYAHRSWGRLPWRRLVEPAIRLADEGILVTPLLSSYLARVADTFAPFPASVAAFLGPDGAPPQVGERLVQSDLAWSLRQIADGGAAPFYAGGIAERVVAAMAANGGLITREDLAAYEPIERPPVRGTYRGYEIVSMPPPSSGGVAVVEMLNMLETFDLKRFGDPNAPEVLHLLIEAMRQGFLDRARYLGDTDFVDVPLARLVSKEYARALAADIVPGKARVSAELGAEILTAPESAETTHYSVVDSQGSAVSTTYTIEAGFGSRAMAQGTGFLLNNEMGDFNAWPGVTNARYIGTEPNLIAPGKRMLSSMTPTIVARDGKPVLVLGSPGGRTIINTVLRIITNTIDFEQGLSEAVEAPRLHHQWMPDIVFLESAFDPKVLEALRGYGHQAQRGRFGSQGDAHSIALLPGGARLAVADSRRAGAAAAY